MRISFFIIIFLCASWVKSQNAVKPITGKSPLKGIVDLRLPDVDFNPLLTHLKPIHAPAGDYHAKKQSLDKAKLEKRKTSGTSKDYKYKSGTSAPRVAIEFMGNSGGIPNDNDISIGNNGKIISVLNSNLRVFDTTGTFLLARSLSAFASQLGTLERCYDPRTLYDPVNDRFIVVFLQGNLSDDNNPIVCLTKTNNPEAEWNCYQLPGNPLKDSSWSDYPIIALTKDDLFITFNLLNDSSGWKDGFKQSIVWQLELESGYNGDSINHNLWTGIKFNNRPVWSICPAQGGLRPAGPDCHLFSVRPSDFQNDTIFHHRISNSVKSGKAELVTRVVTTDRKYGLPPSALQPNGEFLETNDARILTAMVENEVVHFAGNCIDTNNYASGIYYGHFTLGSDRANLSIISTDTLDFGYPDIAYMGSGIGDHTTFTTFSHVSDKTNPGTSVVQMGWDFTFSEVVRVKEGSSSISRITDSEYERWGDYSGIQRVYNQNRAAWLAGTYGQNVYRTTIAKIVNDNPALGLPTKQNETNTVASLYPNPVAASEIFKIEFLIEKGEKLDFVLHSLDGKTNKTLLSNYVKPGKNEFSFELNGLVSGVYYLVVKGVDKTLLNEKLVVIR